MKWDVHPESLKSSYHLRYSGYGGIGYYRVYDTYIALVSRFLACGAYEGHAILNFVAENRSLAAADNGALRHARAVGRDLRPGDSLGIERMPRICCWQDLHLFRSDTTSRHDHTDGPFTATVDWDMIEARLPNMLRVTLFHRHRKAAAIRHSKCRHSAKYDSSMRSGKKLKLQLRPRGLSR